LPRAIRPKKASTAKKEKERNQLTTGTNPGKLIDDYRRDIITLFTLSNDTIILRFKCKVTL